MWYVATTVGKYIELLKQLGIEQTIDELEKHVAACKRIGAKTTNYLRIYPINIENEKAVGIDYNEDNIARERLII